MCSRKVSDTANGLRKTRKKKSSAVPLFRSGHMSAICARLSKGNGEIHKRVENRRLSTLLCPRRVGALPAEVQRKPPRPSGANTLTQFARPGQPVQEKGEDAKSNGETAANFVYCYKIAQNRSVLLEMTGAKC